MRGVFGLWRLPALVAAVVTAVAACGGCGRFDAPADDLPAAECGNISIADLVAMYRGGAIEITENLIITGRVTSSDRAGNFYRSLMVEQDGAAVELRVALTEMHNIWPVGSGVAVRLQGLAMGGSMGVRCIGLPAEGYSYNTVDYIPSRVEADRIISRLHGPEPFGVRSLCADMLDVSMCGCLVRVTELTRAGDGSESPQWGGANIFVDEVSGARIAVSVSDYADFANHQVPAGRVVVTGILQFGRPDGADEDMFILKPRYEEDILY